MKEKMEIEELRKKVDEFIKERNWEKYHDLKNLAMAITVEASEIMEILQWVRNQKIEEVLEDEEKLRKIKKELADVLIYCFSLANRLDVSISDIVSRKIKKNQEKYPVDKSRGEFKKYTELEGD